MSHTAESVPVLFFPMFPPILNHLVWVIRHQPLHTARTAQPLVKF